MNKKFFSAVLMGALLLGGTFVSCQDYDDDIENLQNQIDKLASADVLSSKVSELQSAISAAQSAAEAKAAAANTVAEAAKKAAGDADAKAAAAQKAADDVKAAAGNYATKEEATAAANAAQKVANDLKSALETAVTEADINKAIDAALETALAKYATTEALAELSAELDELQAAIAKAVTPEQLAALAEKVAALEAAGVPGVAAAVASVAVPAPAVSATRTWAIWDASKHATGASATRFAALKAEFAKEIALLDEDGKPHDQGGYLPVVVNPSNVDLSEGYTFALQSVDGKVAEVEVAEVVKGLPAGSKINAGALETKASAEDNLWSVKVVPAKNKYNQYEDVKENTALVIEDGEGVAYKTAFAYKYASKPATDVKIEAAATAYLVDGEVNVFEKVKVEGVEQSALFTLTNEANGIFLLSVENKADVARYGIGTTKDGKLTFSKFPSNKSKETVRGVKLVALGLNGSTAEKTVDVEIVKTISGATPLSTKTFALDYKNANEARWDVEELGMDEAGIEDVLKAIHTAGVGTIKVINSNGNTVAVADTLKAYRANGLNATTYKNFAEFGFDFTALELTPGEYTVEVTIGNLFFGQGTIITTYPTSGLIKLYEDLCDKNGVLQITGTPDYKGDTDLTKFDKDDVTYNIVEGFQLGEGVKIVDIIDLDEDDDWTIDRTKVSRDTIMISGPKDQLEIAHNFSVVYTVNNGEKMEMPFEAALVSPIYMKDGSKAVTLNTGNLTAVFGVSPKDDGSNKTVDNTIDLTEAIKDNKGTYAAGYNRGKQYNLFGKNNSKKDTTYAYVANHKKPLTIGGIYALNAAGNDRVEVTEYRYIKAFWNAEPDKDHPRYVIADSWKNGAKTVEKFYKKNEKTGVYNVEKSVWVWKDAQGKITRDNGVALVNDTINNTIKRTTSDQGDVFDYEKTGKKEYLIASNGKKYYVADIKAPISGSNVSGDTIQIHVAPSHAGATDGKPGYAKVNYSTLAHTVSTAGTGNTWTEKDELDFYKDYRDKLSYEMDEVGMTVTGGTGAVTRCADLAGQPYFEFAEPEHAAKYIKNVAAGGSIADPTSIEAKDDVLDVPNGQVTVMVNLVVKDWWGKTMTIPVPLTLKTK